jgi:hypothetical protein
MDDQGSDRKGRGSAMSRKIVFKSWAIVSLFISIPASMASAVNGARPVQTIDNPYLDWLAVLSIVLTIALLIHWRIEVKLERGKKRGHSTLSKS